MWNIKTNKIRFNDTENRLVIARVKDGAGKTDEGDQEIQTYRYKINK